MWDHGIPARIRKWAAPVETPGQSDAAALLFTRPQTDIRQSNRPSSGLVVFYHGGGNDRIFGFGYMFERLLAAGFSVLTGHLAGHGAGGTDLFTIDNVRARVDALLCLGRSLRQPAWDGMLSSAGSPAPIDPSTRLPSKGLERPPSGPVEGGTGHRPSTMTQVPSGLTSPPVFILGQSMGGAFALDQVARGLFADKVVSVSAPTSIPRRSELFREAGCLLGVGPLRAMLYGGPLRGLPAYKGFRREEFPVRVPDSIHYIRAFSDALKELDLVRRLARLEPGRALPPILLHHGAKDGVIPVSQALELAAALGNRATVRILARLHHLDPLLDRNTVEGIAQSLLFD